MGDIGLLAAQCIIFCAIDKFVFSFVRAVPVYPNLAHDQCR